MKNGSDEESNSENFKERQNSNIISKEGVKEIIKNITKEKQKNTNINDNSINRSGNNMTVDDNNQNLNGLQINNIYMQKVEKKKKSKFNIIKDLKKFDEGRRATINFNIFDYYCLRKIPRKKTKIELFNSGINFYKRQMDIINYFNILMLTQIMLTQQSIDEKYKYLNQTIEISIK